MIGRRILSALKYLGVIAGTALISLVFVGTILSDIFGRPTLEVIDMSVQPVDEDKI